MTGGDQVTGLTRLVALPRHDALRLDQFLAAATTLSRRRSRALVGEGLVSRNGELTRVQSRAVEPGDVVDVLLPAEEIGVPTRPEIPQVSVLHDDGWLLVADKPSGVLSQPAERQGPDELALDQRLLLHLAVSEGRRPFLRAAHRLDRVTSGTMLFARRGAATAPIAAAFKKGLVERWYLAVVEGVPEWTRREIETAIGRDRSHPWRFWIAKQGKPSRTEVHLLTPLGHGFSLVACRLHSGRTHQVRVHLSAEGLPVLGDRLYGSSAADQVPRALLHAFALSLPHPAKSKRKIAAVAPIPADLASLLPLDLDTAGTLAELRMESR